MMFMPPDPTIGMNVRPYYTGEKISIKDKVKKCSLHGFAPW